MFKIGEPRWGSLMACTVHLRINLAKWGRGGRRLHRICCHLQIHLVSECSSIWCRSAALSRWVVVKIYLHATFWVSILNWASYAQFCFLAAILFLAANFYSLNGCGGQDLLARKIFSSKIEQIMFIFGFVNDGRSGGIFYHLYLILPSSSLGVQCMPSLEGTSSRPTNSRHWAKILKIFEK